MDLLSTVRKTGSRGGVNFSWDDVATSAHRENYMGHSLKAPVGRWQQGRDLTWYAKVSPSSAAADSSTSGGTETAEERRARERSEEIRKIKEAEEDAIAKALGRPVAPRDASGANSVKVEGPRQLDRVVEENGGGGGRDCGRRGRDDEGRPPKELRDSERQHRRRHHHHRERRSRSGSPGRHRDWHSRRRNDSREGARHGRGRDRGQDEGDVRPRDQGRDRHGSRDRRKRRYGSRDSDDRASQRSPERRRNYSPRRGKERHEGRRERKERDGT